MPDYIVNLWDKLAHFLASELLPCLLLALIGIAVVRLILKFVSRQGSSSLASCCWH